MMRINDTEIDHFQKVSYVNAMNQYVKWLVTRL